MARRLRSAVGSAGELWLHAAAARHGRFCFRRGYGFVSIEDTRPASPDAEVPAPTIIAGPADCTLRGRHTAAPDTTEEPRGHHDR